MPINPTKKRGGKARPKEKQFILSERIKSCQATFPMATFFSFWPLPPTKCKSSQQGVMLMPGVGASDISALESLMATPRTTVPGLTVEIRRLRYYMD